MESHVSMTGCHLWRGLPWTDEEKLLQFAGHLRGRALQEWTHRVTFADGVKSLRSRVDPENRVLAGQEFRHAVQESAESVAGYIRRLERLFQTAYSRDGLSTETRGALLYSQLQEGLRYGLIKSPEADSYSQLCIATKHEEKRLNELARHQQYLKDNSKKMERPQQTTNNTSKTNEKPRGESRMGELHQCYVCGGTDHIARTCRQKRTESTGQAKRPTQSTGAGAKVVKTKENPLDFLQPDSDDEAGDIKTVRIQDKGSKPREVLVDVPGVPVTGVIDSGADITIMGAELFKRVALVGRLKKSAFKKPDKTPYTYDHQPFSLNGKLELDITFNNHTMHTPPLSM